MILILFFNEVKTTKNDHSEDLVVKFLIILWASVKLQSTQDGHNDDEWGTLIAGTEMVPRNEI